MSASPTYYADHLWKRMEDNRGKGATRATFLCLETGEPNTDIRQMGEELDARMGFAGMQAVTEILQRRVAAISRADPKSREFALDLRELDSAWHGIGQWRS